MNLSASFGVAIGMLVGLVIVVICLKLVNRNHRAKTEYDERQVIIRGRGYRYAFYSIVIYECCMLILGIGEISLPIKEYMLHFGGICLGCVVLACYSIWNDVYWGLNNSPKRYIVLFAATAVLNAIPVIGSVKGGTFIENGKFGTPFINVMVLVMLLILAVTLLVKYIADHRRGEED